MSHVNEPGAWDDAGHYGDGEHHEEWFPLGEEWFPLGYVEGGPEARATWHIRPERCHLEIGMPARLGGLIVDAQTAEGSPLAAAIMAVMLAVAGAVVAGVSVLVRASLGLTVAGFLAPAVLFFLILPVRRGHHQASSRPPGWWRPRAGRDGRAAGRPGGPPRRPHR